MSSEKDEERSNKGFQSLSGSLSDLTKKILGKNGFVEIDIITNWDKIAGKETARYVQPQSIDFKKGKREGGILVLSVCSGAFATEMMHKKNIIIEKVNTYFGYGAVSDIKVVQVSSMFDFQEEKSSSFTGKKKTLVTTKEQNYISEQTSKVQNERLREILQKLGENIFEQDNKKDEI